MRIDKLMWLLIKLLFLWLLCYYFYPEGKLLNDTQIDNLVVLKSKRLLLAFSNGKVVKTFKISLGSQPIGHKEFEGDKKTPEGVYYIIDKNPNSTFHKNLGISYPDNGDVETANQFGKSVGGHIKIHGLRRHLGFIGKFHRLFDWTSGCIAVTNEEIEELYYAVKIGSRIEIKP
jgi:murein L,D-transpeptidase YafK